MAQDLSTTPRRAALLALALAATLLVTVLVQMRTPDRSDAGAGAALDGSGARVDDAATAAGPTGEVLLAFAGEVHLEGVLEGLADQPGSTLGPLSRALSSADLAVLNLESAITDGTTDRARKELEVRDRELDGLTELYTDTEAELEAYRNKTRIVTTRSKAQADHEIKQRRLQEAKKIVQRTKSGFS